VADGSGRPPGQEPGSVPNPDTGVGLGASDEGSTFEPEEDVEEGEDDE
jgi:hypothetical protein